MVVDKKPGRTLLIAAWAACLLAVLLFLPRVASAVPAVRYAIKWSTGAGAESCAQQSQLTAAVARLVSEDRLVAPENAERFVEGTVSRSNSWRAELRVRDAAGAVLGERRIESGADACRELDAAVALAIALIVDPDHSLNAAQPDAASSRPPAPIAAEVEVEVESKQLTPVRGKPTMVLEYHHSPQLRFGVDAVVLSGVLPDPAFGAQMELWRPIVGNGALRLALAYFAPQSQNVPERAGTSAKFYVATARLMYCGLLVASAQASVFGCGGLDSGVMAATGRGGGFDRNPVRALLALDGAFTVEEKLGGPWALSVTPGAGVTPFRPKFSYQTASGPILVHRRSALEGYLEIGIAYRF